MMTMKMDVLPYDVMASVVTLLDARSCASLERCSRHYRKLAARDRAAWYFSKPRLELDCPSHLGAFLDLAVRVGRPFDTLHATLDFFQGGQRTSTAEQQVDVLELLAECCPRLRSVRLIGLLQTPLTTLLEPLHTLSGSLEEVEVTCEHQTHEDDVIDLDRWAGAPSGTCADGCDERRAPSGSSP